MIYEIADFFKHRIEQSCREDVQGNSHRSRPNVIIGESHVTHGGGMLKMR